MSSTTNSKMMAYDTAKKSFDYVKCENGILTVSGGGGGGGGDASASNQLTQITEAQTTNNKLTTVVTDLATVKSDLHASLIVQEAINDKIDVRVTKCDTDNISGQVTIDSTDPVQTVGMAQVYGTLNNTFLTTDADQNLRVFVENQSSTTGLALESTLLNIKTQADKLKFTGDKLQVETITGFATSAKQDTQIQAQAEAILAVDGVANKLTPLPVQQAKYTIEAVPSLAPGLNPTFTAPPSGIPKDEGWYFKNTATGQPSQVYFYSYTNPALAVPAMQKAYQIDDVTNSYAIVRILAMNSGTGLPFMGIYSRPTGSGDHVPGFYKSRKTYSIPNGALLTQGMKYLIHWGTVAPSAKLHPELARIPLELSSSVGPGLGTEQLAFLTINTDSTALAGNAEYILGGAGFSFGDSAIMDSLFTGESSSSSVAGDASSANQTLQLTQATNSNLAITSRLDNSNLIQQTILEVLGDSVPVINYGMLNDLPTYIPIRADSTGNLFVYDARATSQLVDCVSELSGISGVLADLTDGTQQIHVALSGADDSISIMGFNSGLDMPETITLTTSGTTRSLDVNVTNDIVIDSSTPVNTLLLAKYGENNTFLTVDANQNLNANITNTSIPVTGTFWPESQPVSIENLSFTAGDELIVYDGDTVGELQTLNGKITKCDTDSVSVSNMITGFATESTLNSIKGQTDLLTFSSKDGLNALLVKVDNQLTTPFSVTETNPLTDYATETTSALIQTQTDKLAFSTTEIDGDALNVRMYAHDVSLDEIRAVRMGESSGLMVENAPGTSIAVTIADTVPISSGSPLDVHIYGSTDGTPGNWHHIKTNPNGVVSTNAIMETDANGALTSTSVSGTETYNALHVLTKGTTTVTGTVKTQAQNSNNTQVANNASVVGPMRIGNADADTQGYLWVSAIFSFTSVSSGGQVYLEVSHDGSIWARPSSASTFVMSSGASVTGAIILSTPCPFRYVRLWVDSGFNGSSCNAWVVAK